MSLFTKYYLQKPIICSPFLCHEHEEFKNYVGDYRPFLCSPEHLTKTDKKFNRVDSGGIHECSVYKTKIVITLSTEWSSGGRPFTGKIPTIVLPAGSDVYEIPYFHQITRADLWTHLTTKFG